MQSSIQSGLRSVSGDPIQQFRENVEQLLHTTGLIGALARRSSLGGVGIAGISSGQQGQQGQIGQRRAIVDVDIYENQENYTALIEVAGLSESDIEIQTQGDQLTIRAQRQPPQAVQSNQTQALLQEREYGSVQRQFTLPSNVNRNGITASVVNGLLTLVIPKSQDAQQQQKIQVQRGTAAASGSSRS